MTSSVTLEGAQRLIGTLPTLSPQPNATSIRNLEVALFDALEGIPSHQSPEYGYKGMAQQTLEYALDVAVPWTDVANPGPHRVADGTLDVKQQRDADAIFEAHAAVWKSQDNVQRASISALNLALPKKYKRTNGIGTSNYNSPACEIYMACQRLTKRRPMRGAFWLVGKRVNLLRNYLTASKIAM